MDTVKLSDQVTQTRPAIASVNGSHADAPKINPWDALRNAASQLAIISGAQLSIWKMMVIRMAVAAVLGIPMLLGMFILLFYGFVLLDRAFGIALDLLNVAPWMSPLVRGGLYFLIPLMLFWTVWGKAVSCDTTEN